MNWIDVLNKVLKYIEAHLSDDIDIGKLASEAAFSRYYLQTIFSAMTGMSLSDYLKQRRLSVAGQELQSGEKVIDTAFKYGYATPESFQKAFKRFHGVSPRDAAHPNVPLRFLSPLHIQINLKGGNTMNFSIENVGELTIIGMERRFHMDTCFAEIPKFWDEFYKKGYHKVNPGWLGVCFDDNEPSGEFSYLIASFHEKDDPVPEGFVKRAIAPHMWAKFRAIGAMPGALQKVNRQIFSEWLPNNPEYDIAEGMNMEIYTEGDNTKDDYVSEIWLPVKTKK